MDGERRRRNVSVDSDGPKGIVDSRAIAEMWRDLSVIGRQHRMTLDSVQRLADMDGLPLHCSPMNLRMFHPLSWDEAVENIFAATMPQTAAMELDTERVIAVLPV